MAVSRQGWRPKNNRSIGLRHGFRSGLEEMNAKALEAKGVPVVFEKVKVEYLVPAMVRTYTPDFELPNAIIVETKGKFEPVDRAKHLWIKLQHPDLDIRFVFQRPNTPIAKGSKTTYAMWADKHGFKWATKLIPDAWAREQTGRSAGGPRIIHLSEEAKDRFSHGARKPHQAIR